jgi:hypothetical protein
MIEEKGIQVTILAGAGGPEYECFHATGSARTEIIRSEMGAQICPRLTITSAFQWYDANMLSVEVNFGTAKVLYPRRVFKPADGEELVIELDKWVVWSPEHSEFLNASFEFCDIKACSRTFLIFETKILISVSGTRRRRNRAGLRTKGRISASLLLAFNVCPMTATILRINGTRLLSNPC